jgi:hypothetical protein
VVSLFERLDRGRPPTEESSPPIERLLDWLVNHWARTTVTAREIYTYGPNSIRNKKTTLSLAQILVERGRLVPIESKGPGRGRHDRREWKIVRATNSLAAAAHGPTNCSEVQGDCSDHNLCSKNK